MDDAADDAVFGRLAAIESNDYAIREAGIRVALGVEDAQHLRQMLAAGKFQPAPRIEDDSGLDAPYWIKGLIPAGAVGYLFGKWGVGKTFVALEMAAAIADGREFLGQRTAQGVALFSCGEGQIGIRRRIRALRVEGALKSDNFFFRDRAIDMRDGTLVDSLIDDMETVQSFNELPLSVLFLDTQRRHMGDGDENPGSDTAKLFDACCHVRDAFPGLSVVLIGHEGHAAGRQRGHSNQPSDADFLIRLVRNKQTGLGRWSVEKSKDGDERSGGFTLRSRPLGIDDRDGEPMTSMVVVQADEHEKTKGKPLTQRERTVISGLRALLSVADGTTLEAPDSVKKDHLLDWIEKNTQATREQRRGVAHNGLKGLKERGLVQEQNGQVFLLGELP